jgi:hypothetical protein
LVGSGYIVGLERRRLWRTYEVERALTGAIEKRMLEGSGKLSKVTTVDGVVQVMFLEVTDDANVFDTLSGALLDLRLQLEVEPDLDVRRR